MNDHWTVGDMAEYFKVVNATIRDRTQRHSYAFSGSAVPDKGEERRYTPRDVAVMEEIDRRLKQGDNHDDIRRALQDELKRDTFKGVTAFPEPHEPEGLMPVADHERMMSRAQALVAAAQQRAEAAEEELKGVLAEVANLKGQMTRVEQQLAGVEAKDDEINRLNREIGRLEYKIETLEAQLNSDGKGAAE